MASPAPSPHVKRVLKADITSNAKLAPAQRSSRHHFNFQRAAVCGSWDGEPDAIRNAGGYAKFRTLYMMLSSAFMIQTDNVIDTHKQARAELKRCL